MGLSVLFMFILRNVFIAEMLDGRPETRKTVTVRFSEFEASFNSIREKVVEALGATSLLCLWTAMQMRSWTVRETEVQSIIAYIC